MPWHAKQLPYILVATVLMTLQPILVKLSQVEGKTEYSYISTTLLSETAKITISFFMLMKNDGKIPRIEADVFKYAIPAVVYFINNNLVFVILEHVDSTTFQILSSMKTIFTGILFRVFLKRRLSVVQWTAILLLACGTATSQLPDCARIIANIGKHQKQSSLFGLCLAVITCMLSAFGGIYSEKLLKDKARQSIHWQNIQLYCWGIMCNGVGTIAKDSNSMMEHGFFTGYNIFTWAVIFNNALNGLAISAILKYADNIARVYAHAAAMLVTMMMSVLLFGAAPTPQLIISIAIVSSSTFLYNQKYDEGSSSTMPKRNSDADSEQLLLQELDREMMTNSGVKAKLSPAVRPS